MALSKTTQDHDEIKAWAEKRGGKPADVESTETDGEAGIIRLEFPDAPNANDANLKEIDWEPFFEKFDKSGLAMVYQEVTSEGAESNFCKFVHPENISGSAKKTAAKKSTAKKASVGTAKKAAAKKTAAAPATKAVAGKKATASKTVPAKKTTTKSSGVKAAASASTPKTKAAKAATKGSPATKTSVKKGTTATKTSKKK